MFEQMRQRLIEKAIRGQLVPQSDSEPEVEQVGPTPEEVPFEIPNKWKWLRLDHVAQLVAGQSPNRNTISESNGLEFHQGRTFFRQDVVGHSDQFCSNPTKRAQAGSVLLCVRAPVGDVNVTERDLCIGRGLWSITPNSSMELMFLYFALKASNQYFNSRATGTTFKAINGNVIKPTPIPVPPIEEQRRIVAKMEYLLAEINKAENAYKELVGPLAAQYKALILDKAMRGQLVPQLDSEPEVEQIGEVPKGVLFDIPKTWKWVELGQICDLYQPKTIPTKDFVADGAYRVYGANGVIGRYSDFNHENAELVMACRGATCGALNTTEPKSWVTGNAMVIHPKSSSVSRDYLRFALSGLDLSQVITGSAQPQITRSRLSPLLLPIPPLKEQRRIVKKLEDLLQEIQGLAAV